MPCSLTVKDCIIFNYNNGIYLAYEINFNAVKRRQASLQKPFK